MTPSLLVLALIGCGGAMLDLSRADPGGDVSLEGGSPRIAKDGRWAAVGRIGVDPVSEHAWVVRTTGVSHEVVSTDRRGDTTTTTELITQERAIFVVAPDGERRVSSLPSDIGDLRITFPSAGPLLFGERHGQEVRTRLDRATLQPVASDVSFRWSWGTRTSPSGDWVVVADNTETTLPLHLLDPRDLSTLEIPHGGDWLEGGWLPGHDDLLIAASFRSPTLRDDGTLANDDPSAYGLTWKTWDLQDTEIADAAAAGGFLPESTSSVPVDGVWSSHILGMSWVTGAPDGSTAAVPVLVVDDGSADSRTMPAVALLDVASGTSRLIPDLRGPVAFTPDSTTIVGWDHGDEGAEIVLVDLLTEERQSLPMPQSVPEYAIVGDGHVLIVQPAPFTRGPMLLHDLDTGGATTLPSDGPNRMDTWVHRPDRDEIWAVERPVGGPGGTLFRIDLDTESLSVIDLTEPVEQLNHLPGRDQLVVAGSGGGIFFHEPWIGWIDMDDAELTGAIPLAEGTPFDAFGSMP